MNMTWRAYGRAGRWFQNRVPHRVRMYRSNSRPLQNLSKKKRLYSCQKSSRCGYWGKEEASSSFGRCVKHAQALKRKNIPLGTSRTYWERWHWELQKKQEVMTELRMQNNSKGAYTVLQGKRANFFTFLNLNYINIPRYTQKDHQSKTYQILKSVPIPIYS